VQNTLAQIQKINKKYYDNTIILNNSSTCLDTIEFLKNTDVTIIENENNGPWVSPVKNAHIYDSLPDKYVLTDPDLQFNENLPSNFIEILSELSDKYKAGKVGFALDIADYDQMYEGIYAYGKSIFDWEIQFWESPLYDSIYEIYVGGIDTTFALVNKQYAEPFFNLRVAGDFTAKHLPWYKCNGRKCNGRKCNGRKCNGLIYNGHKCNGLVYNLYENYEICNKTTEASTTKKLILSFIEENYVKVCKNDEIFFIEKSADTNIWSDDSNTFDVLDNHLRKDKVFIDIGGSLTMYGSRKSKHVFSIGQTCETETMLQTNCIQNYTLINDKNVSIERIIQNHQIDLKNISLICFDKGEENMLEELIHIHKTHNVPLYVRFPSNHDLSKIK
jgi:predicted protein tyrosine phosphatase